MAGEFYGDNIAAEGMGGDEQAEVFEIAPGVQYVGTARETDEFRQQLARYGVEELSKLARPAEKRSADNDSFGESSQPDEMMIDDGRPSQTYGEVYRRLERIQFRLSGGRLGRR